MKNEYSEPNEENQRSENDAAIMAGIDIGRRQLLGDVKKIDGHSHPYMLDPNDVAVSLEKFLDEPLRSRGVIHARTPKAFADYVTRFKRDGATVAFPHLPSQNITAILDYHGAGSEGDPGTCEHTVVFTATPTPDWRDWFGINDKMLPQEAFADFIEDHLGTIGKPDGASLLEMISNFQVDRKLTYRSAVRTQSGTVKLTFDQEEEARGQQSDVPAFLELLLVPFEGAQGQIVRARLRYRIGNDGKLAIGVKIISLDKVIETSLRDLFEKAEEGCPGVPFIEGTAALGNVWGGR